MAIQVKMWTMEGESDVPQYFSKVKVLEEETYVSLRVRLEEKLRWSGHFSFGTMKIGVESDRRWRV